MLNIIAIMRRYNSQPIYNHLVIKIMPIFKKSHKVIVSLVLIALSVAAGNGCRESEKNAFGGFGYAIGDRLPDGELIQIGKTTVKAWSKIIDLKKPFRYFHDVCLDATPRSKRIFRISLVSPLDNKNELEKELQELCRIIEKKYIRKPSTVPISVLEEKYPACWRDVKSFCFTFENGNYIFVTANFATTGIILEYVSEPLESLREEEEKNLIEESQKEKDRRLEQSTDFDLI